MILRTEFSPLTARLLLEHPEASVYELDRVCIDGREVRLLGVDLEDWFRYYVLDVYPSLGLHHLYLVPSGTVWALSLECDDPANCSDVMSVRGRVELHELRRSGDPFVPAPEEIWNTFREEAGLPPVAFPSSRTHILSRLDLSANWTWKVTWHRGVRA